MTELVIDNGEKLELFSKGEIDNIIREIQASSSTDGYLDHTIRAVEEYILKGRGKENPYRITKYTTKWLPEGRGFVYIFWHGSSIKYSSKGSGMDKRFAIAHELGHLVLHYDPMIPGGNSQNIRDPKKETQASYFAKKLLNERKELVEKYTELTDANIRNYCKVYNEELLEEQNEKGA